MPSTQPLEFLLGQLLTERKLTIAVAESCTGGLICHRLTNVPGSSTYFLGGVVAYAYDAKEDLLGVQHNTLYDHGAVSEATAREMARGVRRVLGADIGVAVTGIAGPGGGMPGKSVGLTWIALSGRSVDRATKFVWDSDREGNKALSAEAVLRMVVEYLSATETVAGEDG
ncbi:MAG: CinA family protein [Chloroflexi bacterium]|nr:CinA family protein [Chloroflexota bacterium]MBI3760954.1 CinA family protein [Chloroflexota bacterium]